MNRQATSLRIARLEDVQAISQCVQEAYSAWVDVIGQDPAPMQKNYAEVIGTSQVVVAEVEAKLAGVLVLSETTEGFLVESVSVQPSHQGQGIGKKLLAHAEQEARAKSYASIYLYTNEKMVSNIALYSRAGYVEYERRSESGFSRVFMRKVLG